MHRAIGEERLERRMQTWRSLVADAPAGALDRSPPHEAMRQSTQAHRLMKSPVAKAFDLTRTERTLAAYDTGGFDCLLARRLVSGRAVHRVHTPYQPFGIGTPTKTPRRTVNEGADRSAVPGWCDPARAPARAR